MTTYTFTFSKKAGEDCFTLFKCIVDEVIATIPRKKRSIDEAVDITAWCSSMARELHDGMEKTITGNLNIND